MNPQPRHSIYLAGPMRGYFNFNFAAFDYAAAKLRAEGFFVFSPAERDREVYGAEIEHNPTGDEAKAVATNAACTINDCMKADTAWLCDHATAIALLPGWEKSSGAGTELSLARTLGLTVIELGKVYVEVPHAQ